MGSAETAYHAIPSSVNMLFQRVHKQVHLQTTLQGTAITAAMFSLAPILEATNWSHSEQKRIGEL